MPKKKKVIDTLYEELKRKDKLIEKLKEDNFILVKTALKASEKQIKAERMKKSTYPQSKKTSQ